jgi:hypothetical protein
VVLKKGIDTGLHAGSENLDANVGISRTRKNIKISAKGNLTLCKLKQQKP